MLNRAETCYDKGVHSGAGSFSVLSLSLSLSDRPARPHSTHIFTISEYLFKYAKY